MRILHLLGQHPAKTGSGTSMRAAIREMDARGHAQFAVYGLNAMHELVDVGCPSEAVVFSREKDGQILFGMSDLMPYASLQFCDMTPARYKIWARRFLDVTRKVIEVFQPDVILGHHLHLYTALIAKHTEIPVVGVCHGTDLAQLERNPRHREHVKKAFRKVPLILANSPAQIPAIQQLLAYPEEKIQVLGGGYDPTVFYPGSPPIPPPYEIVFAGKISEHKGLRPLYHALARLPRDSFRLTVAGTGEGEETKSLVQLGDALELPVHYAGFLNQEELGALYRKSHLFVLPSFNEGLSLATLEALGAGLSCVVMDWPNLQAFLPPEVETSGQIHYVPRISDTPVQEDHPRFRELTRDLADAINANRTKMFSSGSFSGIITLHALTWEGRMDLMEQWVEQVAFPQRDLREHRGRKGKGSLENRV